MARFAVLLLAFVVAVATTAVPARTAAHAAQGKAVSLANVSAATEARTEARNGSIPSKRCQNGAGLLGCPFERPATIDAFSRAVTAMVRFESSVAALTGRPVPTDSHPPKAPSA